MSGRKTPPRPVEPPEPLKKGDAGPSVSMHDSGLSEAGNRAEDDMVVVKGRLRTGKGTKRLALSSPEAEGDPGAGLSVLTDTDLASMRMEVAEYDYKFSVLVASSKESVSRKEELEQTIRLYRDMFNRIHTEYVKLRTERDTARSIWRQLEGPSDAVAPGVGEGGRDVSSLRTIVREEVARAISETRKDAGGVTAASLTKAIDDIRSAVRGSRGGRLSYAEAAGSSRVEPTSARGDGGPGIGPAGASGELETIEVVPGGGADFADASATMNAVLDAIKPAESGVRVDRINKGRNKSVRIVAAPSEIGKIKPVLSNIGLDIKHYEKLCPRILVRDVPADMDHEEFFRGLIKQNLDESDAGGVKVIYWYPARDRKNTSVVLEVSPEIRRRLLDQGRAYLGWTSCRVVDHLRVTQCFKCLGFGHISPNCRLGSDVCGHCSGGHETRSCANRRDPPKCFNCSSARLPSLGHSALDTEKCPILQRRLIDRSRRIQY